MTMRSALSSGRLISQPMRLFSTSSSTSRAHAHVVRRRVNTEELIKIGDPLTEHLKKRASEMPPYPYGEATLYKQSNRGLYGGRMIQFGNKVSDFGNRNVRTFKPNVHWNKLWSEALNRQISVRVVTSVLKTITKEGGLDNYLTKDKPSRIKELGPLGWKLRYQVLKKLEAREKAAPKPVDMVGDTPVFVKYATKDGTELLITLGRVKLLKRLFGVLKSQQSPEAITYKHFLSRHRELGIAQVVDKLEGTGFDLTQVALQEKSTD
jgi:large subunit ribosomal protein L28